MLFTSFHFVIFFATTFAVYYVMPTRVLQLAALFVASLVFYAFNQPAALAILLISALMNGSVSYFVLIGESVGRRRLIALFGVVFNLALLGFFKYRFLLIVPHLTQQATFSLDYVLFGLPLPIGISFYTFQGISLLVDVFRKEPLLTTREVPTGPQFVGWSLFFICFFPHSISGPIVKAREFLPQIGRKVIHDIPWEEAIRTLIVGYFLKMVVANNMQNATYLIEYPYYQAYSTLMLVALLLGYSIQIFADFAGYSLIAIGLALLLGYRLPQNFNFPYIAQTFSEFWRRWHMSLSSWLRNYLYIPLGGNRYGEARTYLNLFITMVLGGLWHGAAWSYAVWGTWHGLALALERPLLKMSFYLSPNPIAEALRIGIVFIVVTFGWLLFKLPDFNHVIGYLVALKTNTGLRTSALMLFNIAMLSLPVFLYHLNHHLGWHLGDARARVAPFAYAIMLFLILFNSRTGESFIYFQF